MASVEDEIDAMVASGKVDNAKLAQLVARAQQESDRLDGIAAQSPEKTARIARETAAGQMAPPSFMDKMGAAVFGAKDGSSGNLGHDITRTGRDVASGLTFGLSDKLNPELRAQETAEDPTASRIGKLSGTLLSSAYGPLAGAAKGGAGLLGLAERAVPALGKNFVGRIAGQAAIGGGIGAGDAALNTVARGGSASDVGRDALHGAKWGAGLGAGFQAIPEIGRPVLDWLKGTKGGQARQLLEKFGVNVGPLDSGSGGVLNTKLQGLGPNEPDIGIASERAAKEVIPAHRESYRQDTQLPFQGLKAVRDASPAARKMRDADSIYDELNKLADNEALTDAEAGVVTKLIDRMESKYQSTANTGPRYQMSERKLNEFRQKLDKLSKAGSAPGTTTPAVAELKGVAKDARDMVDTGPYGDINKAYSEGTKTYKDERAMMGLKGKPSADPQVDVNKLSNTLATRGHPSQSAGRREEKLDDIIASRPDLAESLQLPDVLRAKGDLGFSLVGPGHGGLLAAVKEHGMPTAAAIGLGQMLGHSKLGGGLMLGATLASHNAAPIAGRLMYGPAEAAANSIGSTYAGPGQSFLRRPGDGSPILPGFIPEIEQAYADALARLQGRQETP